MTDFPPVEFEARLQRLQSAMHGQKLDALFFTTEAEMRYFTGFRTLFWQSPTRPWFLVVPKSGKPVAVIPEIGASLMGTTWINDIRCWASPDRDDDGVSLLASALTGAPRIGMMMGRESWLRMPLADFERLKSWLPGSEFIDATALVSVLRMVKSTAEIDIIRAVCSVASRSFAKAGELFSEGQSLKDAFRSFRIGLLQQDAEDVPYLVGGAGQGGYSDVISPPGDQMLRRGDVLMLDTGATLQGYYCDFDRNFAVAYADDVAKRSYRVLHKATDLALSIARPGVRCCDLFTAMSGVIDQDGGSVGRMGHGLGMQLTEAPSLIGFDETVLKTGMVITLEPSMIIQDGKIMVHEENIVINEAGAELLSERAPPEMPII